MSKLKDAVQWQTVSGEAVTVGDVALTPQSQALTVRWPKGGRAVSSERQAQQVAVYETVVDPPKDG